MKRVMEISSNDRRAKLRQVFNLLSEIDLGMPVETFDAESLAVEKAVEALKDGFGKDFLTTCEGCSGILLVDDQGQRCREGESLCAECAKTWGEIKEQWDADDLSEDEPGEKAGFLARYEAHIAAGGTPEDKLLYPL